MCVCERATSQCACVAGGVTDPWGVGQDQGAGRREHRSLGALAARPEPFPESHQRSPVRAPEGGGVDM